MKNIDIIRSASEEDLIEILYEQDFECDERCPDFECGCFETCEHDHGLDFIRYWLNKEAEIRWRKNESRENNK